jgi:hypothetical protein
MEFPRDAGLYSGVLIIDGRLPIFEWKPQIDPKRVRVKQHLDIAKVLVVASPVNGSEIGK